MAMIAFIPILYLSTAFLWIWWNRKSAIINWPLVGMIPGLARNVFRVHDFATFLLQQNGGTFLFKGPWFSGMDFVVTSDSKNVHYILSKNFANYQKGRKELVEPLGDGIINSDIGTDIWRIQSRMIHSLFNSEWYKAARERAMEQKILNDLFQVLENASKFETEVDLQDIVQRLTFDNICLLLFGFDLNCLFIGLPQVPLQKAFHQMEEAVFHRYLVPSSIWKLQKWLQIGKEKQFKQAFDTVANYVLGLIAEKRRQFGQTKTQMENTKHTDLLAYFLTLENTEQQDIDIKSDKFLKDMVFNLLVAGSDTIAAALVWLFWLVGTHPLVEQKILEEIKANLRNKIGEKWRPFSSGELNKLTYLHAVVCETLRLYPPVPFNDVVSVESDTLPSGLYLHKNMRVIYCLYSMGRMEEIWGKDCMEFKPERWISKQGQIKHVPSYKFITFNEGPKTCLGKNMALMEIKAVASAVIWNFSIQIAKNHVVGPSNFAVLFMKKGLKVKISKRSLDA